MKRSTKMNWLACLLLGLTIIVLSPRTAIAGDLEWILMDLETELDAMRFNLDEDFDAVVLQATFKLQSLDARGASEAKLNKTAKKYKKVLANLANSTIPRLNRIQSNYMFRVLRENVGAAGTRSVNAECNEYVELVRIDLNDAKMAVDEALAAELAD